MGDQPPEPKSVDPAEATKAGEAKLKNAYVLIGSIIFVAVCLIGIFGLSDLSKNKYEILKVMLAVGATAFLVAIPGTLEIKLDDRVKAGGRIGGPRPPHVLHARLRG